MKKEINVLVVDDEQIVLDSINKHLRKENYAVHTALSAQDALVMFDQIGIDIVLADLMMPHIDGLELMKEIKLRYPKIPVIINTGYATINTALQATQLGAFDYLAKPFSKAELKGVIKRAVELVSSPELLSKEKAKSDSKDTEKETTKPDTFKTISDTTWVMLEDDGLVLMGVERSFLITVGRIQSVFLPSINDELRQGSVFLQIFSTDLHSHSIITPLSGTVVDVNDKVRKDPNIMLQDSYETGWLIRLKPSNFDYEIKMVGL